MEKKIFQSALVQNPSSYILSLIQDTIDCIKPSLAG